MFLFLLVTDHTKKGSPIVTAITFAIIALVIYVPAGYYLERFLWRRRMAKMGTPCDGVEAGMADVRMFTVGPLQENCFLVRSPDSDRAVLVDPGEEPERLLGALESLGITRVEAILLTHTHFDHVGAVAPLARATGAPVYCPELERQVLANIMDYVLWPGLGPTRATRPITSSAAVRRWSWPG